MKSCIIWCKKKNSDFFWKKDFTVSSKLFSKQKHSALKKNHHLRSVKYTATFTQKSAVIMADENNNKCNPYLTCRPYKCQRSNVKALSIYSRGGHAHCRFGAPLRSEPATVESGIQRLPLADDSATAIIFSKFCFSFSSLGYVLIVMVIAIYFSDI